MTLSTQQVSELLGISRLAADVYIEVLTHQKVTRPYLQAAFRQRPAAIGRAVGELLDRAMIRRSEDERGEILQPTSLLQLEEEAERRQHIVQALQHVILPQLNPPEALAILKYEGWEGVRKVYLEILEEAIKRAEPIYAIEDSRTNAFIGEAFVANYVRRRVQHGIHAYVLCGTRGDDEAYRRDYGGPLTSVKLVPRLTVHANVNVVGSLVMTFASNPPRGTLRYDLAEADTWRSMLRLLWGPARRRPSSGRRSSRGRT